MQGLGQNAVLQIDHDKGGTRRVQQDLIFGHGNT
jgi:hypothetical protein